MNPGDTISVHMFDAPASGGGHAFEVVINDLTTHQTGFMQASGANGFMTTSASDCSGNPFNFEPEYSTAGKIQHHPLGGARDEHQHRVRDRSLRGVHLAELPADHQPLRRERHRRGIQPVQRPVRDAAPHGQHHRRDRRRDVLRRKAIPIRTMTVSARSTAPVQVSHCQDNVFQNGDLDFDGTPYWKEWPTGLRTNLYPSSFLERFPTTNGRQYPQFFFQTDVALSEATCCGNTSRVRAAPWPAAPCRRTGPGGFYPYWTQLQAGVGFCALEFGNVSGFWPEHLRQGRAVRDQPVRHARVPRVRGPGTQQHLQVLVASEPPAPNGCPAAGFGGRAPVRLCVLRRPAGS